MNLINQDLLAVKKGIIAHQVNCKGIMGAGIAKSIRQKYPIVYEEYRNHFKHLALGKIQVIKINNQFYIVNLMSQFNYGRNRRHTDYEAMKICFLKLHQIGKKIDFPIYLPYKIGCGNAGGDWDIVSSLIDSYLPEAIICKLG